MKDIYQRLQALGFDAPFVRSRILPDWWDDGEATVPATRSIAEFAISRFLGIPIASLRDPKAELTLPALSHAKLKLRKNTRAEKVAPGLALAERAAHLVVGLLTEGDEEPTLPKFGGARKAADVREQILADAELVNMETLLEFAWSSGIIVLHLAEVPKGSKCFDGMACFVGQAPVIVLASRRKSPPWVAFHLAHELGHILLGHVTPGSKPLVDVGLEGETKDSHELEADRFALETLVGKRPPQPAVSMNGSRLAAWAQRVGAEQQIDPGSLVLVVGQQRKRLPAAQNALKALGLDVGAHGAAAAALAKHFPHDLPDDLARILAPETTKA